MKRSARLGACLRTFSTFNQPFPFALFVMLSLLVGGAVALAEPRRRRNLVFLCLSPLLVVAMATSVVRASILGLLFGVIWLAFMRFRAALVALAVAAAAFVACLPFLPGRVLKALFSSSSLAERNVGWREIFGNVFAYPLGRGLGATGAAAERMAAAAGMNATQIKMSAPYQPDNYYVKILIELGPVGLWALIALLVTALLWTVRLSWSLPGRDGALALGVSASIVGVMVASTVSTYFESFPLDFYFWLLLGVVGCAAAQHESDSARWLSGPAAAVSRPTSGSS